MFITDVDFLDDKCCPEPLLHFLMFRSDCKSCPYFNGNSCEIKGNVPTTSCQIVKCLSCGNIRAIQSLSIEQFEKYEEIYGNC